MAWMAGRKGRLIVCLALGATTFLVYARSLGNGFVTWDDGLLILENPIVQGFSLAHIAKAFTSYDPELYIPLTFLSYQINYGIAGLEPFLYHLTNLLLHTSNVLLVVWLGILLSGRLWVGIVTGFLFAVHPLHTETVAWASARKDVLSAFFFLLSTDLYLFHRRTGAEQWYGWSLVAFLLGLLSKVTVIVLPLLLLLFDWREGRRWDRKVFLEKIPYFVLSTVFGVIALFGKVGNTGLLWEKTLIGAKATVFYLEKLFVPSGFSVLYPYTRPIVLGTPDLLIAVVVVTVLTVGAILLLKRTKEPLFAWVFYLLFLFPTFANFAKGRDILRDVYFASDRYAYLPSIGIIFLVTLLLSSVREKWKLFTNTALCSIVLILALLAFRQSLVWKDSMTLFRNVLVHYPNSHVAHNNIGAFLYAEGRKDEALAAFEESLAVRPNVSAFFNLGEMYTEKGRIPEAIAMYRAVIEVSPFDLATYVNLGVLLLQVGDVSSAIGTLEQAERIDTTLPLVHFNLGLAYERAGRTADAFRAFRRAAELDPADREALERARALSPAP